MAMHNLWERSQWSFKGQCLVLTFPSGQTFTFEKSLAADLKRLIIKMAVESGEVVPAAWPTIPSCTDFAAPGLGEAHESATDKIRREYGLSPLADDDKVVQPDFIPLYEANRGELYRIYKDIIGAHDTPIAAMSDETGERTDDAMTVNDAGQIVNADGAIVQDKSQAEKERERYEAFRKKNKIRDW